MKTSPSHRGARDAGRRALVAALAANVGIAAAKAVAFFFTGSVVMLAEVAHSLADGSKQVLLFVGRLRAQREPDPEHPLGYGPERYFWAFVVAILLFPLGALWTSYEAVEQLREPRPITHVAWAAAVLLVAMMAESLSLRVAVREARRAAPGRSLWRFVRRSRDPDLPSVLLEDASAVLGAGIGLVALALAVWTGDPRWDAVGGLAIALLLLATGAVLVVEFKSLLIGESAAPADLAVIRRAIRERPHVERLVELRTLHLAPDQVLVLARIALDPGLGLQEAAGVVSEVESEIHRSVSHRTLVHVACEPQPRDGS